MRLLSFGADLTAKTAGDACSREVVTIAPDGEADEAVRLMREHALRRLPVGQDGHLEGVVSLGDLAEERDRESALAQISAAEPNR